MDQALLTLEVKFEHDVVLSRQRARQLAAILGFDNQDQTRIATAVSEIARNVYSYAQRGRVTFRIEGKTTPQVLVIQIADQGPGISNLRQILDGQYHSETGMGLGILGARRLMDRCEIESAPGAGTTVRLRKILPPSAPFVTGLVSGAIAAELVRLSPQNPFEEVQQQNQELIRTLDELRRRQDELVRLNQELEDTNRGVLALYAELDEKADHLRRADQMKSRFLSNMSHEFRTPLNSIMALARILQDRTDGDLTREQEKQVGFIRKAAESLTEIVNDLLDLAKVEAGKTDIVPFEFTVDDLFGALRGMLRPLLAGDSVRLVFDEPEGIPTVFGDEGKVSQILRNFISNALKFTEKGEIRVSAETRAEGTIVFCVADTGIGISDEDKTRIFGEFQQVNHPLQRRVKGTGLGLPLSKKLAELLQGRIWLESTRGVGSRFYLEIPAAYREPAKQAPAPVREAVDFDPLRLPILVVEDSEDAVEIYDSLLRDTEFQVFTATDLRGARQAMREIVPTAVILDIRLRGQDSWSFLVDLKKGEHREIPVLVVTNLDDEEKALSLGADAYFPKPAERPWLLTALRNLTRARRPGSVLIVDDDELWRYTLADALRGTHFDIIEAENGEAGWRRARADQPLAILLDLEMPGLDGFGTLAKLKSDEATRDIPVIVVTSSVLPPEASARLAPQTAAIVSKERIARGQAREQLRDLLLTAGLGAPTDLPEPERSS